MHVVLLVQGIHALLSPGQDREELGGAVGRCAEGVNGVRWDDHQACDGQKLGSGKIFVKRGGGSG